MEVCRSPPSAHGAGTAEGCIVCGGPTVGDTVWCQTLSCLRNEMPRDVIECDECGGPHDGGVCFLHPTCSRNRHWCVRREIHARIGPPGGDGASASAPPAAGPAQPASAARQHPRRLYLAPGRRIVLLHTRRENCQILAQSRCLGAARDECPNCGAEPRQPEQRWFVDDTCAHVRDTCPLLDMRFYQGAAQCPACFVSRYEVAAIA